MGKVKLGLIGCGRIAELVHLNVITRLPEAKLVAIAECDATRREQLSRRAPKAALFEDYRELMQRCDLEAVVICLPPALHAEAAIAAFENRKHVYLEKPLATNIEDAKRVLLAWKKATPSCPRCCKDLGIRFLQPTRYRPLEDGRMPAGN